MPSRPSRPFVGLSTLLFLVVTLNSATSVPSTPGPLPPAPTREEIRSLEELSHWVAGDHALTVLGPGDLPAALRRAPRGFELFRRFNGSENREALLVHVPYGRQIFRAAQRHGVDSLLLAAVVEVESGYSAAATSPVGAVGLMQVMPATAELYGIGGDLHDPATNLEAGSRYFHDLLACYGGDIELSLAAYNAGPGNVKRYGGVPPFPETRAYVDRVLSAYVGFHRRLWDDSGAAARLFLR